MLEINHLNMLANGSQGQVPVLDNINLSVPSGQFCAALGASGSGKTSLMMAASAHVVADSGSVTIGGNALYEMSSVQLSAFRVHQLGVVFQQSSVMDYLTVEQQILFPFVSFDGLDIYQNADDLIKRLELTKRRHHKLYELSPSERQRVVLARALLLNPVVVLADEPTAHLDNDHAQIILSALREYCEFGGSVLLTTQSSDVAGYADRIVKLDRGKLS